MSGHGKGSRMTAPFNDNLFQNGVFVLHSGKRSSWKIECDALTPHDWETLALMASEIIPPFGYVYGIPRGGCVLAMMMQRYATKGPMLICDDVLTTGGSMNEVRTVYPGAHGLVVFARGPVPSWITPIFRMAQNVRDVSLAF